MQQFRGYVTTNMFRLVDVGKIHMRNLHAITTSDMVCGVVNQNPATDKAISI